MAVGNDANRADRNGEQIGKDGRAREGNKQGRLGMGMNTKNCGGREQCEQQVLEKETNWQA